jgi:hypothetical protein
MDRPKEEKKAEKETAGDCFHLYSPAVDKAHTDLFSELTK